MARQTLIHLHGTTRLADATKLNLGEIAVRNAATKADTELAVLTSAGDALVYIPSLDKVTGLTSAISNNVNGIDTRLSAAEGKVTALETFRDSSAATKADIAALSGSTSGNSTHVTVKVDQAGGKITGVTVTEDMSEFAKGADLTALGTRVGDNEADIAELQAAVGVGAGSGETLTSRVSDLEALVGDSTDGLVKDVADNTAAISANTAAISANTANIAGHGTKIEALESSAHTHDNKGVIDGITSAKVNAWDNAESNAIASAKTYVDSAITATTTALNGQISAVDKKADDNADAIDALEELVGDTAVATQISNAIGGLDASETGSSAHVTVKVDQLDGVITGVTVTEDMSEFATSDDLSALQTKVNTLVGDDEDMSAREIAAAEVAKVIAEAPEDFDTLQEIAAWISSDETSSAQMVSDIDNLKKVTSGYTTQGSIQAAITAAQTKADNNATAITGLQGLVGETPVATQISDAIGALDATAGTATVASGKHVAVEVIEQDGKVTAVNVAENDIASADALVGVKSTADTAVQSVTVSNLTGVSAVKTGTAVAIDFSNMTIDCGEY